MGLPRKVFAPAFAESKTRVLFLLLVGVMVYIATFALGIEGLISAFTLTWDQNMDRRMTIELPLIEDESSALQSDRIKQIISLVSVMPEVDKVKVLSDSQTHDLLKPWIDQPELLKSLPVPSLIDIDRKPGAVLTAQDLRDRLRPVVNAIQVDDHAVWLADLVRVVRGLMIIAGIVIALTFVAVVFAVSLLCRVVVATEQETIALLHIMGAEDGDVARHFQYHAGRLSVPAALCGYVFGAASAGGLVFFLHNFADTSFLAWQHWAILGGVSLLIPIMTVMIAATSARLTVTHFLDQAS